MKENKGENKPSLTAEEILKQEYFKLENASQEDWDDASSKDDEMHNCILKAIEAYAAQELSKARANEITEGTKSAEELAHDYAMNSFAIKEHGKDLMEGKVYEKIKEDFKAGYFANQFKPVPKAELPTDEEIMKKLFDLFGFNEAEKQGEEEVFPINAGNQLKIYEFMKWMRSKVEVTPKQNNT